MTLDAEVHTEQGVGVCEKLQYVNLAQTGIIMADKETKCRRDSCRGAVMTENICRLRH